MVPSTFLSLVLFLLLIAPGIWWDLKTKTRRVIPKESAFRESSRVVLYSLGFSAVSVFILVLISAVAPTLTFNIRTFLADPGKFYQEHPLIIWRSIIFEVCLAFILVLILHSVLKKKGIEIREVSIWHELFKLSVPNDSKHIVARVKLKSGTVYVGNVVDYTPNFEMVDRELVLGPPLFSKRKDDDLKGVGGDWQRLILKADSIESITVGYTKTAEISKSPQIKTKDMKIFRWRITIENLKKKATSPGALS